MHSICLTRDGIVEPHAVEIVLLWGARRNPMRTVLAALIIATGAGFVSCQNAGASPGEAAAIKETATAASPVQQAQYREGYTRHGVVKCYRFLVLGHYRCHYYRDF